MTSLVIVGLACIAVAHLFENATHATMLARERKFYAASSTMVLSAIGTSILVAAMFLLHNGC